PEQAPSGAFDLVDGTVDVVGVQEPKAEMRHASPETGRGGVLGEGEDVVPTRRLSVDEPVSASRRRGRQRPLPPSRLPGLAPRRRLTACKRGQQWTRLPHREGLKPWPAAK